MSPWFENNHTTVCVTVSAAPRNGSRVWTVEESCSERLLKRQALQLTSQDPPTSCLLGCFQLIAKYASLQVSLPTFPTFFQGVLPVTKVSSAHRNLSQRHNLASVQGYSLKNVHYHNWNQPKCPPMIVSAYLGEPSLIVQCFRTSCLQHIKLVIHFLYRNGGSSFNQSPFNQHVDNLILLILSLENHHTSPHANCHLLMPEALTIVIMYFNARRSQLHVNGKSK